MRKAKYFAIGLAPLAAFAFGVAPARAEEGSESSTPDYSAITDADVLKSCLSHVEDQTCSLAGDVVIPASFKGDNRLMTTGTKTLDLKGHTITVDSDTTLNHGIINVGTGLADNTPAPNAVATDASINDRLTITGGGKITTGESGTYAGVAVNSNARLVVEDGVEIDGYYYGVTGNGNRHYTEIEIGKATLKGVHGTGIYHPQYGSLTLNGTEIIGKSGVEIRSGKLTVKGDTKITATADPSTANPNGNGTTTEGSALAIVQHTTRLPIDVDIQGGTFKGINALYEANLQNNGEGRGAITLSVSGGNFEGAFKVAEAEGESSFIAPLFVTGGTFTDKDASKYFVVSGSEDVKYETEESENSISLVKTYAVSVSETENGTLSVAAGYYKAGSTVTINIEKSQGYSLESIAAGDATVTVAEDGKTATFEMPSKAVNITASFEKTTYVIKKEAASNGSFKVSESAAVDDIVKITEITPNDGFAYTKAEVIGVDSEKSYDVEYSKSGNVATFTMPDEGVIVKVTFTQKVTEDNQTSKDSAATLTNTSAADKIFNATLDNLVKSDSELKQILEEASMSGKDVEIETVIEDKTADTLHSEVVNNIEKTVSERSEDLKIASYFEIGIGVKVDGNLVTELTELTEAIEFTVDVPSDLPSLKDGYTRTFYIVREHDGKVEILPTTLSADGKTFTFKSDKFSSFAIAYADTTSETNKNLADATVSDTAGTFTEEGSTSFAVFFALVSVAAVVYYMLRMALNRVRF